MRSRSFHAYLDARHCWVLAMVGVSRILHGVCALTGAPVQSQPQRSLRGPATLLQPTCVARLTQRFMTALPGHPEMCQDDEIILFWRPAEIRGSTRSGSPIREVARVLVARLLGTIVWDLGPLWGHRFFSLNRQFCKRA